MNHEQWKYDAVSMYKAGKTYTEIAESLGKPYFTITTHLHRHLKSGKFDRAPVNFDWVQIEPPKRKRNPTTLVIGDLQVKQGISLDYIHYIGAYIAKKQPDIIVQIGDWFDNAALSSYDRGQLSAVPFSPTTLGFTLLMIICAVLLCFHPSALSSYSRCTPIKFIAFQ